MQTARPETAGEVMTQGNAEQHLARIGEVSPEGTDTAAVGAAIIEGIVGPRLGNEDGRCLRGTPDDWKVGYRGL